MAAPDSPVQPREQCATWASLRAWRVVPIGEMPSIPELSVSPAMVLLSRASPGVSQTPSEPPERRRSVDHACPVQGDDKPQKGSRKGFLLIHVRDQELVDQGLESLSRRALL